MTPLADDKARERIRSDLDATLIVEAAAGTGKTTELVARIVALIRSGRTTLDRILSVTFTDLAAGEMKLRLRAELESARAGAGAQERDRFTAALERLEAAPIGTIHSFCADLLRERPVEARVDPLFEVKAGEEQDRLFDQAFDAWFQSAIANPPEGVRRLLRRKVRPGDTPPRAQLRQAGWDLSEHRDFTGSWRREPFDRAAGLAEIVDTLAKVGELAARAQRPDDWAAQSVAEIARWVAELRRREAVRPRDGDGLEAELHELCRRRLWHWRGGGRWFGKDLEKAAVLAQRDAARAELQAFLDRCDADLAACLREELRPLCDGYERLKAAAGAVDFLDLLLRARDLVRDDPSVRRDLSTRFTHVLVDEFQDTDPLQAEILLLIASNDPAESRFRNAAPAPGKLFVVGDPKQSIYRFRRADIALYEDVKRHLLASGAELLHLTTSFRSVPAIQQAVNAGFAPRMEGGTQARYVALDPFRGDIAGQPAVVALPAPKIYGKRDEVTSARIEESYPDAVAAFVDWLVTKSGWKVSERERREPVPVEPRHVCLLFKRMRNYGGDLTRRYVQALEARQIPHVLVGGRSYHAREEVQAMRAVATAIEWPDDELAVFAALRGPLLAVGDDALVLFRERHGRLHPLRKRPEAIAPGTEEVFESLALLGELHLRRNRRPIAETFSRMLDATRAHAGVALWGAGEQALANVLRILELARRFESAGASSFRAFVDRLADDAEHGEASEAPVVEEGTEGVRIMSVHKAKGLEFPVVVLCDPCAPPAPQKPSRLVDPERKVWAMPLAGCAPSELLADAPALLQRDREEVVRVAYVAATRARDLLVVPVTADEERESWLEPLHAAVYPAPLLRADPAAAPGCPAFGKDAVLDRPERVPGALAVPPGLHAPQSGAHRVVWWDPRALELDKETESWLRERDLLLVPDGATAAAAEAHSRWQRQRAAAVDSGARASMRVQTATARSEAEPPAEAVPLESVELRDFERPRGRRFGTLVHAVLAEVDLRAGAEEVRKVALAQGRLLGATPEEVTGAARAAAAALSHPLLLRAAAAEDCRREEPILHRLEDGTLLEGVVDLAFRDASGWTVVDFKTDAQPASQPRYAAQLRLYCAAITAVTHLPARPALLAV